MQEDKAQNSCERLRGSDGWLYCYINRIPDPENNKSKFCEQTTPSVFEM